MKHLFELGLAIGNLLLTRASVGTLTHEEMVFCLEIEGLLQRRKLAPVIHLWAKVSKNISTVLQIHA